MRRRQRTFRVVLDIPREASEQDAREYILDAVRCWRGSLYPGYLNTEPGESPEDDLPDPMFDLNPESVKVYTGWGSLKER